MNMLSIDTTNNKITKLELMINGKKFDNTKSYKIPTTDKLLQNISELLTKNNMSVQNIDSIEVIPGPGSYTGIRVGLAVANTLAKSLNIPVNNNQQATPIYT